MKRFITVPLLALTLATPAVAQDEDGFNLMEEGAKLFLRGLMTEMEPAIDELETLADELGPAMRDMAGNLRPIVADIMNAIDDIQYYREIEVLENGDILIRRDPAAPPFGRDDLLPLRPGEGGEIDAPQIDL